MTADWNFDGIDKVIGLIREIVARPRHGDVPPNVDANKGQVDRTMSRRMRREFVGLPIVCVVDRAARAPGFPDHVAEVLTAANPRAVRHALVHVPDTRQVGALEPEPDDVREIRALLDEACRGLHDNARRSDAALRFPLFTLASWLTSYERPDGDTNRTKDWRLASDIQAQGMTNRVRRTLSVARENAPSWLKPWLLLTEVASVVAFWLAVSGLFPGFSGRYRWFVRQPHVSPELSGRNFLRFAGRLTQDEWPKEAAPYVARLLVNAFLEDLRRAYRLRPWQLLKRRPMTYPVLLLADVSKRNRGYQLLRLVSEIRNQTGAFDPLLIVATSVHLPPGEDGRDEDRISAEDCMQNYGRWQDRLSDARRKRAVTTWYLTVKVPATEPGTPHAEGHRIITARQAFWTTRTLRFGVPLLVVAVVAASVVGLLQARWVDHCGSHDEALHWTGTECYGLTDGGHNLFQPSDATVDQVDQVILAQNQRAEALHASAPRRPYITLVEVQAFTSPTGSADALATLRESVEGAAVAQWRQLGKTGDSDPIVRILIGNGGRGMGHGVALAEQIGALAARDDTVVGVIGLDMSTAANAATVAALTSAGIPIVASTLSEDHLADDNPTYFSVSPKNLREAATIAAFADHLRLADRTVRIYYADDPNELYSTNLRDDLVAALRGRRFAPEAVAFEPNTHARGAHLRYGDRFAGNATAAGRDVCTFGGVAVFAGRGEPDFASFADGAKSCGTRAVVIGGDDVTKYVADGPARAQNRGLPYYFVSFAPVPSAPSGPGQDFYTELTRRLFGFEQTESGRSYDGHAALEFDAATVLISAAEYLRELPNHVPGTPGAIWREITAIHASRSGPDNAISGVTGRIDFGGDIAVHVPPGKPVSILRVVDGQVDGTPLGECGRTTDSAPVASWCPAGDQ